MFRLFAIVAIMILGQSTGHTLEYFGFSLGMTQADAVSLAQRRGYKLQPTQNGYFLFSSDGPDYLSFCGGRLFAIGKNFDGGFSTFIWPLAGERLFSRVSAKIGCFLGIGLTCPLSGIKRTSLTRQKNEGRVSNPRLPVTVRPSG
jgi:hypothetical protein